VYIGASAPSATPGTIDQSPEVARRTVAIRSTIACRRLSRMTRGSTGAIPSDASPKKSKNVATGATGKTTGSPIPSEPFAPVRLLTRSTAPACRLP